MQPTVRTGCFAEFMSGLIITHHAAGEHQVPIGHPERPARYAAVMNGISRLEELGRHIEAEPATRAQLEYIHTPEYLDEVCRLASDADSTETLTQLDADTWAGAGSLDAALRGAGAGCMAVDHVLSGQADFAFSAMRPPGHHAEPDKAMGFCLFSNAAIAAEHARRKWGLETVAVLDFDVHHGNGTQAAFWNRQGLFYASSHQMPLYPGSGHADETGEYQNIFNVPLNDGEDGTAFLAAWSDSLLPQIRDASPELIIISAGFDAHKLDPLAGLELSVSDFGEVTKYIAELADKLCGGRVVSMLEGGYHLEALTDCTESHLSALLGR